MQQDTRVVAGEIMNNRFGLGLPFFGVIQGDPHFSGSYECIPYTVYRILYFPDYESTILHTHTHTKKKKKKKNAEKGGDPGIFGIGRVRKKCRETYHNCDSRPINSMESRLCWLH